MPSNSALVLWDGKGKMSEDETLEEALELIKTKDKEGRKNASWSDKIRNSILESAWLGILGK